MKNTSIEWADHTFNPWIGCTKVSAGCANCYAEAQNARFKGGNWGKGAPRRRTSVANWKQVLRSNEEAGKGNFRECLVCGKREFRKWDGSLPPGGLKCCSGEDCVSLPESDSNAVRPRVFCASMADWLDDEVPFQWRVDLFQLIATTPNLDWLLLTKRPESFRRLAYECLNWVNAHLFIARGHRWVIEGNPNFAHCLEVLKKPAAECREYVEEKTECLGMLAAWLISDADDADDVPPENVWIGVSVENQEQADKRIPELLEIPAKVRFLSCEPLLGPIRFADVPGFNKCGSEGQAIVKNLWVICGGESGSKARPMHPDWARSLRDQCAAAGVPFFFKQWGEWSPRKWCKDGSTHAMHRLAPGYGVFQQIQSHPDSLERVGAADGWQAFAKVGKNAAGRLLDGAEHSKFPKGGAA